MATYDRAAIKGLIQAAGFGADAASVAAQEAAITAAFVEISGERAWSWLRGTYTAAPLTVGSEVVPLPGDFDAPLGVRLAINATNTPYEPLEQVEESIITRHLHLDTTGALDIPTEWSYKNGQVLVWPRPSVAFDVDLDYVKNPSWSAFDADGELGPWKRRFDVVVVWMAIRWLAIRQRDTALYQQAATEAANALRKLLQGDPRAEQTHVANWGGWSAI